MKKLSLTIALVFFAGTASAGESYELKRIRDKVDSRKDKLETVNDKIADLKLVISEMTAEAEPALVIEKSIDTMIVKERENRVQVDELEAKVSAKAALLAEYRKQFQVKYDFTANESLGDFTTQDGKAYKGVVLKEVNDDSIRIAHANGFGVVEFANLPNSLSDRVSEPPSTKQMMDIASVLDERPDALKSSEQIYDDRKADSDERYKAAKDARASEVAKLRERQEKARSDSKEAAAAAEKKRMADAEARKEISIKVSTLRGEITTLNNAISQQESAKRSKIYEMQSRTIRPSQQDIDNTERQYDKKIAALRAAVEEKSAKSRVLSGEMSTLR